MHMKKQRNYAFARLARTLSHEYLSVIRALKGSMSVIRALKGST